MQEIVLIISNVSGLAMLSDHVSAVKIMKEQKSKLKSESRF